MTQLNPSKKIKELVAGAFKPPFIWGALMRINQEVIALEVQNEELVKKNQQLVDQINGKAARNYWADFWADAYKVVR